MPTVCEVFSCTAMLAEADDADSFCQVIRRASAEFQMISSDLVATFCNLQLLLLRACEARGPTAVLWVGGWVGGLVSTPCTW